MSEDQLSERVALSVAQWHARVNLCFPPEGSILRLSHESLQPLNGLTPPPRSGHTGEIVEGDSDMAHHGEAKHA